MHTLDLLQHDYDYEIYLCNDIINIGMEMYRPKSSNAICKFQ